MLIEKAASTPSTRIEDVSRAIPFFNYSGAFAADEDEYVRIFRDVVRRGAFIQQRDLLDFERNLAAFIGVKHVLGVGNATDGLNMAWRALGLRPGDEVIFPSHTMVASAASVHFAGGIPVPVDCGEDHLIDVDAIVPAITKRTVAIMPVQLNGRTADMATIQEIADRHGLFVVEDAAQALGSKFGGKFAGTFGRAGVFSFYPAKLLGCFGDGGAVVTNDDELAAKLGSLRDHGRSTDGAVALWGFNSRLDNLQAALLDFQLRSYARVIDKRRLLARAYEERLQDVSFVKRPPGPDAPGPHFDVYQNYEIEAERRDALRDHLTSHGVGTIVQWGGRAVHQHPALGFKVNLPRTERLFRRCLMLPLNSMLTMEEVEIITDLIRDFYRA